MRVLDSAATEQLLPYDRLADEIAVVLREYADGRLRIAERTALPLARGTLLCMPASDDRLTITKVVTVHPGNAAAGRPTITAEMIVADAATGERLALLEGGTVTRRRTAALSLLALRHMLGGSRLGGPVLVYGAGDQARGHCEALSAGFGVGSAAGAAAGAGGAGRAPLEFVIASRSAARAETLAADLRAQGSAAVVTNDPDAVVSEAAVIVTATTSLRPVLTLTPRPGAVVCAVGAFRHDMAELAPAVVAGASRVVVDTLQGAEAEAGDLIQAVAAGVWRWDAAEALVDVLSGDTTSPKTGYGIFKSVGHAMYDLAAARLAFGSAR